MSDTRANERGKTPREVAEFLRVSKDRVMTWIKRGELHAINTAHKLAKPRFVVTPDSLQAFIERRSVRPMPRLYKGRGKVLSLPTDRDFCPELA